MGRLKRGAELANFLADALKTPFTWGVSDCCSWLDAWIVHQRGVSPAGDLRGMPRRMLAAVARKKGGIVALIAARMESAGLDETLAPEIGDVALVQGAGKRPAGAVWTGQTWALKSTDGIAFLRATPIRIWKV